MSGPKADEISPTQQLLQFENDRARFFEIEVECAQIQRRSDTLRMQWENLSMPGAFPVEETATKLGKMKNRLILNNSSQIIQEAAAILRRSGMDIASVEHSLENRIKELEGRFGSAASLHRQTTTNYEALQRLPEAFKGKKLVNEQVEARSINFVSAHSVPALPTIQFNPESIRQLENFESEIAKLAEAIEFEIQALQTKHDELVIGKMLGDGTQRAERQRIFEEALRRSYDDEAIPPPKTFDLHLDDKIHVLIARIDTLLARSVKEVLKDKLHAALEEQDEARKRNLWHSAEIEYSAGVRRDKELREWMTRLDLIERRVGCESDSDEVRSIIGSISEFRRTMSGASLADLESRATVAVAMAAKRRHARQKVLAMLAALQELGYQMEAGAETAVGGGKWVMQKETEDDYALAIMADEQLDTLQMQVVRTPCSAAKDGVDRPQRDFERETAFCAEHAQFRSHMTAMGYGFRTIVHHPPGRVPLVDLTLQESKGKLVREATRIQKMKQRESS